MDRTVGSSTPIILLYGARGATSDGFVPQIAYDHRFGLSASIMCSTILYSTVHGVFFIPHTYGIEVVGVEWRFEGQTVWVLIQL